MSKKGQIFYRESKLKFYLRNSHSTHPCQIYLVASVDGKRYRIYTKMKVYAGQWDQERQLAVISNIQSKQDNRNNKIANNYLNKLRGYFSEFIEYICKGILSIWPVTWQLLKSKIQAKECGQDIRFM